MRTTVSISALQAHLSRWAAASLVLCLLLAACGGPPPPPSLKCTDPLISGYTPTATQDNVIYCLRFWRASTIVAAVVPAPGNTFVNINQQTAQAQKARQAVIDAVGREVNKFLADASPKASVTKLTDGTKIPNVMALTTTALLFFSLQFNGQPAGDKELRDIVNIINKSPNVTNGVPIVVDTFPALSVVIKAVSPDWLFGGGGGGFTGGHPDGPPDLTKPATAIASCPANTGPTIHVYALDTIHPYGGTQHMDTSASLDHFNIPKLAPLTGCNIFADLAASTQGTDVIFKDNDRHALRIENPYSDPPPDKFSEVFREHGLFVSALIHYIAPNAQIHLIRVLNDQGIGDLQTLTNGLKQIFDEGQTNDRLRGAIVNMSLGVLPPPQCLKDFWSDLLQTRQRYYNEQGIPHVKPFTHCTGNFNTFANDPDTRRLYFPLGLVIQDLITENYHLVAAAGNESRDVPSRFGAELPAAICGVTAVAATTNPVGGNWRFSYGPNIVSMLTDFSNYPYFQETSCLHLNSEADNWELKTADNQAVIALGNHICSLLPHTNGDLAFWDGTSFSTAIISGNIAANSGSLPVTPGTPGMLNEKQPCM